MPIDYDHHNREMKRLRAEFEKLFQKRILKAAKDLEFRVTPGTKHLCWVAFMSKARGQRQNFREMTFAKSEVIYTKASQEVIAARDRFITAYEKSAEANLLDVPENTKDENHVKLNVEYDQSLLEFGKAILREHAAQNMWLHCMREENPDLN